MTRIASVSVHSSNGGTPAGLKRQLFTLALSGCDLLVGANGAGKTTRGPLAITAALEGLASVPTDPRRPYVGELPEATAVTLTLDDGETLTRALDAARTSKASRAADQRARDLVGIPPTAWDLRDFASGTDGDRGKILDAVARAGGAIESWDAVRAQAHVRDLLSVHDQAEAGGWLDPLDNCIAALTTAPDGAAWLKAAETWAEAEQKRANAAQKSKGGALEDVTESTPEPPWGSASADEALHRDLLRQRAESDSADTRRTEAARARARHEGEGERLKRALADAEADGKALASRPPEPVPDGVTRRLAEAKAAIGATVPAYQGPDADALRVAVADAEGEVAAANEAAEVTAGAHADATEVAEEAADLLGRLDGKNRAAVATVSALESVSGQGHARCVHCDGEDPLGIGAQLEEARTQATALAERVAKSRADLDGARFDEAEAARARTAAEGKARAARDALTTARANLRAAESARASHADEVRAARQRELAAAQSEFDRETRRAEQRAGLAAAELAGIRRRWTAARDAVKSWQLITAPAVPESPSGEDAEALDHAIAKVSARLDEHRAHTAHIARIESAAASYEAAEFRWAATRALVSALRQARDDLAAAAYAPIDATARELLADAAGLPGPYFDGPGDYGAVVPGRGRVPYAGLSESEQRITAAAIVYALAVVARCPVRLVLLDGLEVVQRDHRAPLLRALSRAVESGRVDNVVATMSDTLDLDVPGLTVHVVERVDAKAVEPAAAVEEAPPEPVADDDRPAWWGAA